jgi:hypothetical protein
MDSNKQVVQLVESEFPYLNIESFNRESTTLLESVKELTAYTKQQIRGFNEAEINHCFKTARYILDNGSPLAKISVETIFIYGVSRLLEVSFAVSEGAKKMFLDFFKSEYAKQVNNQHP